MDCGMDKESFVGACPGPHSVVLALICLTATRALGQSENHVIYYPGAA